MRSPLRPGDRHLGVDGGGDRDQFRRRIEMAQRAAERAAVAGLAVADLLDRLVHQRAALAHHIGEFEIALARHGADLERAVVLADVGQAIDPVEVDDVVRQHEPHVEHRHQRLPAGQKLGVLQRPSRPTASVMVRGS